MTTLAEALKDLLGSNFPVESGSAKRDDPLVITTTQDYFSVEYTVARALLGPEVYEMEAQHLHHLEGRVIDELVFACKPQGAPDWTRTRRFFFDITAGWNAKKRGG